MNELFYLTETLYFDILKDGFNNYILQTRDLISVILTCIEAEEVDEKFQHLLLLLSNIISVYDYDNIELDELLLKLRLYIIKIEMNKHKTYSQNNIPYSDITYKKFQSMGLV